jgi:hypothetical protein
MRIVAISPGGSAGIDYGIRTNLACPGGIDPGTAEGKAFDPESRIDEARGKD